jgi:hypothetical protein
MILGAAPVDVEPLSFSFRVDTRRCASPSSWHGATAARTPGVT